MTLLSDFIADHKTLVRLAAEAVGLADPVALDLYELKHPLLHNSVLGPMHPLDGAFVRDWSMARRYGRLGVRFGVREYKAVGVTFGQVFAPTDNDHASAGYQFVVVGRADQRTLYKWAVRCYEARIPPGPAPVLPADALATIRRSTVDYLSPKNLEQIKAYGGRPKRGLLLTGPPGNGKTSACRYIRQEANDAGLETKVVTPDDYRAARQACSPAAAVKELFSLDGPGVVFFDDLDLALRDRSRSDSPEDQSVFLGALDGMEVRHGIAYVFTTNLPLDLIDPAFRRPGRIDVLLHLPRPDAALRRRMVEGWHADIRAAVDTDRVVRETDGHSFAELDEYKNLMVLRYTEVQAWDFDWAADQFSRHRDELSGPDPGLPAAPARNGTH